jgi:hypothetical protein
MGLSLSLTGASNPASAAVSAPTNTVAPAVTGTAVVGYVLTTTDGTWTGSPSLTRKWQRDSSDIPGETATTYTQVTADAGHSITCLVTGTNGGGSASQASNTISTAYFGTPYSLGTNASGGATTTLAITTTADVAAGDTVVIAAHNTSPVSINSVSDGTNTYTAGTLLAPSSRSRMFYFKYSSALPAGSSITITFASTSGVKYAVAAAVAGAGVIDKSLVGQAQGTTNVPIAIGTLAQANEIIFVGIRAAATITNPITEASGYTRTVQTGSTDTMQISTKTATSTAEGTPSWTISSAAGSTIQAFTFQSN